MKKVLIIYRFLPQYRVDFYNGLRQALSHEGIELRLVYGKSTDDKALKNDEVDIDWATYVPHRLLKIGRWEFIWQPYVRHAAQADLVIVEQANKLLLNYVLMFLRKFARFRLAQWGHGRNMQTNQDSFANRFKSLFINACDWWFPYTEGVKAYVVGQGFPAERVSVVQNAIDTVKMCEAYDALPSQAVAELKANLGIESDKIGLYCGGIYAEKRIDFLLEACHQIKIQIPDFHLVVLGSGAEAYKIKEAAEQHAWIHYAGAKFGEDRLPYFKMASVLLMPGLVGLAILDCFATLTPMITTQYPFHSPEIEYLKDQENGMITANNLAAYTQAVVKVLAEKDLLARLQAGCKASRTIYNNENMVNNFKNGIAQCLSL